MSQKYKLPCSQCAAFLVVEPRHAGNTLKCDECSASIEAPKLRELKQLEPLVDDGSQRPKRTWSQSSGVLFVLGMVLIAVSVGALAYLQMKHTQYSPYLEKPKIENQKFSLDGATLTDTWQYWSSLIKNPDITDRNEPIFLQAREAVKRLDFWTKIFYGIATVGILTILGSVLARPKAFT